MKWCEVTRCFGGVVGKLHSKEILVFVSYLCLVARWRRLEHCSCVERKLQHFRGLFHRDASYFSTVCGGRVRAVLLNAALTCAERYILCEQA